MLHRVLTLLSFLLTFTLSVHAPAGFASNLLIIWGADSQQPWTAEVAAAVAAEVKRSTQPINVYEESLNYNRLRNFPDIDLWTAQLNDKYATADIDLVIAFEHSAATHLNSAQSKLLPQAAKIAILGNGQLSSLANVGEEQLLAPHLSDVEQLLPQHETHLVISSLPIIKQQFNALPETTKYSLASDALSFDEMFKQVAALPANSVITYAVMHRDRNGEFRSPREVLQQILQISEVPVFVQYSTLLMPGVVGGHLFDSKKVAQLIVQGAIDPASSSASLELGTLKLDGTELQRWDIPSERVPQHAELYNVPLTFWQNHEAQVVWALGFIAVVSSALGMTLLLLRSRNATLKLTELQRQSAEQLKFEAEKRLEAELERAELQELSKLAVEAADIGIFRYYPSSDEMWLSERAAAILDAQTNADGTLQRVSDHIASRMFEKDLQTVKQQYEVGSHRRQTLTYRIRRADGEVRWLTSVSEVPPGAPDDARVGVIRDITNERSLTEKLLRAQERMSLALDAAHIELFEIEVDTGEALVLSSGRGNYQIGQRFDFVQGISTLSLSRSTRDEIRSAIRQEQRRLEYSEHSVDDTKHRWAQIVTGNFYERDEKRFITAVFTDITAIREHQHIAERKVRENELALSASSAGVVRIQPRTGRIWMSPRAQEIWDTGPLVGDTTSLLQLAEKHHPDDDERVRHEFQRMTSGHNVSNYEYRIRISTGNYRWIQASARTHYDIKGNAEVIGVFFDIDAEKRRFVEVEEARERQARLFAIIGHELRTPIATLQMMLEEQGVFKLEPYGQQTKATMQHTLSVLDDLRSVTQPQLQSETLSAASLYDLIEQTLGSLRNILQEKQLHLHFFSNPEAQTLCLFNRQSLRQLLTNLIKNAAIHSGASDLWVTAEATQSDVNLRVKVEISDNGKGIPEDQIETLFQPFRRGETHADGTGLGLHICRDLAQRMGGTLTCDRGPNGGARFTFTANFKVAQAAADQPEAPVTPKLPLAGVKVLYAEDQKTLQLLTTTLLKKQGATVTVASDGAEALELFEQGDFDLVLTDIMMPNMSGYDLTTALRERGYSGKIVGLTAATIGLETDRLIALGANETLSKPVDIQQLCSIMLGSKPVSSKAQDAI